MTKWIVLIAFVISGSILGVMYYQLGKLSTESGSESAQNPNAVHIVDGYKDGFHRLSGVIKLPHSCYSIKADSSVKFDAHDDVTVSIVSKNNLLDQAVCANIRTRYPFETIVEGPKVITVHLVVDGVEVPTVVSQVDWLNPAGNVVNSGS